MSYHNETVEQCGHCGKKYLAGCVKGINTCSECIQAGHSTVFLAQCSECIKEAGRGRSTMQDIKE